MLNIKNKSHSVTAADRGPRRRRRTAWSSRRAAGFGGWACTWSAESSRYCYNLFGVQPVLHRRLDGDSRPGSTRCASSSPTTAAGSAKAAPSTLFIDGTAAGSGRVEGTVPLILLVDETVDVGMDNGLAGERADTRPSESRFTGAVNWVASRRSADDDHDHLINPEDALAAVLKHQ